MSCLCSDSVFNICLGSMRLQVRQWCVKRIWINNMAKATEIPQMYQPKKILMWVPVCWFARPCLRLTVQAAVCSGVTDFAGPDASWSYSGLPAWCVNGLNAAVSVGWRSGNGGMPRTSVSSRMPSAGKSFDTSLSLYGWSRSVLRLKPASLISSIVSFI